MTGLHFTVIWAGTAVIFLSLIFSLLIIKKARVRKYMQGFFICPLIAVLLSLNTILNRLFYLYSDKLYFLIQFFILLLDLIFWGIFFSKIFNSNRDLRKVKIAFWSILVLAIISFTLNNSSSPNYHTIGLFNICKTLYCVFFYYKLFKDLPNQTITAEPIFWIVTGLFFYSCLSLPCYALYNYIKLKTSSYISINIFAISNMLIIIMHLFFIKAYLCTIRLYKG